jgi:hypothetical protein
MNQRGQIAFESLLILSIILTFTILILSLYTQIHDETVALEYARIGALEELSKQKENIIIEKIEIQRKEQIPIITITLDQNATINSTLIENMIKENTSLKNIKIEVKVVRQ